MTEFFKDTIGFILALAVVGAGCGAAISAAIAIIVLTSRALGVQL